MQCPLAVRPPFPGHLGQGAFSPKLEDGTRKPGGFAGGSGASLCGEKVPLPREGGLAEAGLEDGSGVQQGPLAGVSRKRGLTPVYTCDGTRPLGGGACQVPPGV